MTIDYSVSTKLRSEVWLSRRFTPLQFTDVGISRNVCSLLDYTSYLKVSPVESFLKRLLRHKRTPRVGCVVRRTKRIPVNPLKDGNMYLPRRLCSQYRTYNVIEVVLDWTASPGTGVRSLVTRTLDRRATSPERLPHTYRRLTLVSYCGPDVCRRGVLVRRPRFRCLRTEEGRVRRRFLDRSSVQTPSIERGYKGRHSRPPHPSPVSTVTVVILDPE